MTSPVSHLPSNGLKIHHLNCGSMCPHGQRFINGTGGWLAPAKMVCHCWLIEGRDGLTLVDTGMGTAQVHGMVHGHLRALLQPKLSLAETAIAQVRGLGFKPEDVRDVVLTHLDFDHAGALADFPHARVHVHAPELDAAHLPSTFNERQRYEQRLWAHGPHWVRHRMQGERWNGFDAVRALGAGADEILLLPLPGHTRAHTGVAVRAGQGWRVHAGDAYFFHREVADGYCTPGLKVFQTAIAHNNRLRLHNQERLRSLNAQGDILLNSAHCPVEFARDTQNPTQCLP